MICIDTKDDGVKKFPKFEGIEKINWADLNDAYGPATKIPMALRKLISNDASTRSEGWNVMHSNVLHQGTLYPGKNILVHIPAIFFGF
jgi:hypothetical protein